MTPQEIMRACADARARGLQRLTLVARRRRPPRSDRTRLFGRSGPLVDVAGVAEDGALILSADADDIEAWLRRNAAALEDADA